MSNPMQYQIAQSQLIRAKAAGKSFKNCYEVAIFEIKKWQSLCAKWPCQPIPSLTTQRPKKNTGCLSCIQIGSNWCSKKMFNNLLTHILPNAKHQKKVMAKKRSKNIKLCQVSGCFFLHFSCISYTWWLGHIGLPPEVRSSASTHPMVSDSDWRVGAPMHWTFLEASKMSRFVKVWRCFKVTKKIGDFHEIPN